MESWVDTIPGRELETEGDLIYLHLDGEGTNVAGTQLLARQADTQIPGGGPNLISRTIGRGGRPAGICVVFISLHCLLELDMT